jgi:hypothetical protein
MPISTNEENNNNNNNNSNNKMTSLHQQQENLKVTTYFSGRNNNNNNNNNMSSSISLENIPIYFTMLKELRDGFISYNNVVKRYNLHPPLRSICRKLGVHKLSEIDNEEIMYNALVDIAHSQIESNISEDSKIVRVIKVNSNIPEPPKLTVPKTNHQPTIQNQEQQQQPSLTSSSSFDNSKFNSFPLFTPILNSDNLLKYDLIMKSNPNYTNLLNFILDIRLTGNINVITDNDQTKIIPEENNLKRLISYVMKQFKCRRIDKYIPLNDFINCFKQYILSESPRLLSVSLKELKQLEERKLNSSTKTTTTTTNNTFNSISKQTATSACDASFSNIAHVPSSNKCIVLSVTTNTISSQPQIGTPAPTIPIELSIKYQDTTQFQKFQHNKTSLNMEFFYKFWNISCQLFNNLCDSTLGYIPCLKSIIELCSYVTNNLISKSYIYALDVVIQRVIYELTDKIPTINNLYIPKTGIVTTSNKNNISNVIPSKSYHIENLLMCICITNEIAKPTCNDIERNVSHRIPNLTRQCLEQIGWCSGEGQTKIPELNVPEFKDSGDDGQLRILDADIILNESIITNNKVQDNNLTNIKNELNNLLLKNNINDITFQYSGLDMLGLDKNDFIKNSEVYEQNLIIVSDLLFSNILGSNNKRKTLLSLLDEKEDKFKLKEYGGNSELALKHLRACIKDVRIIYKKDLAKLSDSSENLKKSPKFIFKSPLVYEEAEILCKAGDYITANSYDDFTNLRNSPNSIHLSKQIMSLKETISDTYENEQGEIIKIYNYVKNSLNSNRYCMKYQQLSNSINISNGGNSICNLTVQDINWKLCNLINIICNYDKSNKIRKLLHVIIKFASNHELIAAEGKLPLEAWCVMVIHFLIRFKFLYCADIKECKLFYKDNLYIIGHDNLDSLPIQTQKCIDKINNISSTELLLLFFKYYTLEFDVYGEVINMTNNNCIRKENSLMWKLSIINPFELFESSKTNDISFSLSRPGQLQLFKAIRRGSFSTYGIIKKICDNSITVELLNTSINNLFDKRYLLKVAELGGYLGASLADTEAFYSHNNINQVNGIKINNINIKKSDELIINNINSKKLKEIQPNESNNNNINKFSPNVEEFVPLSSLNRKINEVNSKTEKIIKNEKKGNQQINNHDKNSKKDNNDNKDIKKDNKDKNINNKKDFKYNKDENKIINKEITNLIENSKDINKKSSIDKDKNKNNDIKNKEKVNKKNPTNSTLIPTLKINLNLDADDVVPAPVQQINTKGNINLKLNMFPIVSKQAETHINPLNYNKDNIDSNSESNGSYFDYSDESDFEDSNDTNIYKVHSTSLILNDKNSIFDRNSISHVPPPCVPYISLSGIINQPYENEESRDKHLFNKYNNEESKDESLFNNLESPTEKLATNTKPVYTSIEKYDNTTKSNYSMNNR